MVVFPWVPDTAMSLRLAQIAASVSARDATRSPRFASELDLGIVLVHRRGDAEQLGVAP